MGEAMIRRIERSPSFSLDCPHPSFWLDSSQFSDRASQPAKTMGFARRHERRTSGPLQLAEIESRLKDRSLHLFSGYEIKRLT